MDKHKEKLEEMKNTLEVMQDNLWYLDGRVNAWKLTIKQIDWNDFVRKNLERS